MSRRKIQQYRKPHNQSPIQLSISVLASLIIGGSRALAPASARLTSRAIAAPRGHRSSL